MAFPGVATVTFEGAISPKFNGAVSEAKGGIRSVVQEAGRAGEVLPQKFDKATTSIQGTGNAIKQVGVDTKALTLSMVGLGTTVIGLATATSRLGQAENRLEKSKVAVRRINDQIASTQKNLNRLIEQGKTNTEDYAVQLGRLETAYIDLETKQTDVKLNQDVLNDTYILFGTTIANTAINSLFLMKSAFSGLTIAQIRNTFTMRSNTAAVVVASRNAMPAYAVSTKAATIATHGLGAALKAAFLPLTILTAGLAAYEFLLAPIVSKHVGFDASLSGMTASLFKTDEAVETVNEDLQAYKDLAGEATSATEGQTNALKELFGLIGSGDTHPMVKFWTGVKLQQEGVLDNLLKIKGAMNDPGIRAATAGFSSAPSGGAILTTGGGGGTPSVGRGAVSQSRIDRTNSEIVTDAIIHTDDVELDKSIAAAAVRGFEEGVPVTYKQLHGVTIAEELQNEFGISHKTLKAIEDFTALELQTTMETIRGKRQIAAASAEAVSNESLQSVLVGGGRQRVFDNDFKIPVGPSNAPAVAEHNRQLMIKLYGEDFFKPLEGQEEVLKGVIAAELKGVITDEFGLTPNTVATLKKIAQEEPSRLLFNLGGGQGFGRPVMSGGNVVGHSQTLGIFTAGSGINMLARTPVKLNPDEQGLADAGQPIMALILANVREGRIPYDVYLDAFNNSKAANKISSMLGLPNPRAVLDLFGLDQGSARINTSVIKEPDVGFRGAEDFLTRTNLQIEGFVQRAKDQGFLSSSATATFNRILKEKAFFEAEAAGFFGTNTGSAVPAQFRFGQVVAGTGMSRERGLELLLASQGGAFGRTAGLGSFEIFPGLFTQADVFQRSDIQMPYRDLETHRRMKLQEKALRFGRQHGALFGQETLGQGGVGRGITQDTINLLMSSQGDFDGLAGTGLQFDSAGNLTSASGLRGFLSPAKRSRNVLTMARLRQERAERDAFLNSEEYLIEQQISAAVFGARPNFIMSRSQADIAKRGGGASQGRLISAILTNILTSGAVGNKLGLTELGLDPRLLKSTSIAMSAFNQASPKSIQEVVAAAGIFAGIGPDMKNFAKSMKRMFTNFNSSRAGRIAEFMIRATENRPIWFKDVPAFVEKSGVKIDRMIEALGTLNTDMHTEFVNDNIDTRNEVLRLEARAYFIEREEQSALA